MNDLFFMDGGFDIRRSRGGYGIFVASEEGQIESDGTALKISAGDVALIPPAAKCSINAPAENAAVLEKALLPVKSAVVIPAKLSYDLREAIASAARYTSGRSPDAGVNRAYGNLVAALICAALAPNGYSPVVKAIEEDVAKHLSDPTYSLESFMRTLPLNYDYVRKLFKKETGTTPHEYLTRMRMEQACNIMLSHVTNRYTEYSVTQIAEACGYSEPLYFSRVFKKYYGVAPSDYFKKVKNKS